MWKSTMQQETCCFGFRVKKRTLCAVRRLLAPFGTVSSTEWKTFLDGFHRKAQGSGCVLIFNCSGEIKQMCIYKINQEVSLAHCFPLWLLACERGGGLYYNCSSRQPSGAAGIFCPQAYSAVMSQLCVGAPQWSEDVTLGS